MNVVSIVLSVLVTMAMLTSGSPKLLRVERIERLMAVVGAVVAHLLVGDRDIQGAAGFLVLSVGTLAVLVVSG